MAKQKKKRNKPYTGEGASIVRPAVTRLTAVNRNPVQQWWYEKKRLAKPILIGVAVATVVTWLVIELVRIVFRSGA